MPQSVWKTKKLFGLFFYLKISFHFGFAGDFELFFRILRKNLYEYLFTGWHKTFKNEDFYFFIFYEILIFLSFLFLEKI